MKISTKKIIRMCVFLSIYTCSFDIFGNITIAGFNFRFCQFIILPAMLLMLFSVVRSGSVRLCLGLNYLLIWLAFQIIFMIRSPELENTLGYVLWLCFNIMTVYLIYYFAGTAYTIEELIKNYLNSFFGMAVLGLVQFFIYFLGIDFYVAQYWNRSLIRINGFSYEPSYYATYMLLGFVAYAYLIEKKDKNIMNRKELLIKFIVIIAVMILSSSRMGWLMMAVWIVTRSVHLMVQFVKMGKLTQFKAFYLFLLFPAAVLGAFIIWDKLLKNGALSFMLDGLGLYGKSSHSATGRLNGLLRSIEIFKTNPWFGVSLGGVDPVTMQYMRAQYETGVNGKASSIIGELLVANGIVGMIPFLLYMKTLLCKAQWWEKNFKRYSLAYVYKAMEWSLIFELAILCFNQNILRIYLWVHIGVICALYKEMKMH